jgi:hypothetical protein
VAGVGSIVPGSAGAAGSSQSNKASTQVELLKQSDVPHGWTKGNNQWAGTSDGANSSSMFTMTQIPDIASCMGKPPALSVVAAEASGPDFFSSDGNTDVFDVVDVYTSASQAKSDFPSFSSPKFANCFLKVEGPAITTNETPTWPTGSTFGTQVASVSHQPRDGDESGTLEVETPVTLPKGQGTTDDFFVAVVIRQGRSVSELLIDQGSTAPLANLISSLAEKVTARMKAHPPSNNVAA